MSDAKFTPGPWRNHPGINICRQYYAGLNIQYLMTSDNKRAEEGEANAHLIVAAPEMYELLEQLIADYEKFPHSLGYGFTHIPKIKAALKKARGEQ